VEFGARIELPFPSRTVEWLIYHSTVHRFRKWEQRRHYCRRCSRAQQVLACRL